MTSGPIEKRLRDCGDEAGSPARRAGELLRELPAPAPLSEAARRRIPWALPSGSRHGWAFHFTAMQWTVFAVLLVTTAAAAGKRLWFPNGVERHAVEISEDSVMVHPAPAGQVPSKTRVVEIEEAPVRLVPPAPSAKAHTTSALKSESVRPRLLSDPQRDAVPGALPKSVYDADIYSVLLDVCVSAQGRVTKVSVVRGQDAALDRDIVAAVENWTYEPGETNGQPVPMCFPLVYRIQVQRE
jgi:TonB family protein